jgi:stage III sporulation protein AG
MNVKIMEHTFNFLKDKKNKNLILGICIAVTLLIAIPLFDQENGDKKPQGQTTIFSTREYSVILTQELEQIIMQIEGVGKAQVLLTMENGVENIYVDEEKINQTGENLGIVWKDERASSTTALQRERQVLVIRDNNGGENPVLVKQIEPKVSGVLVVCDGGNRETVVYQVTNAIKALLDVPSNRIHVMKRKT